MNVPSPFKTPPTTLAFLSGSGSIVTVIGVAAAELVSMQIFAQRKTIHSAPLIFILIQLVIVGLLYKAYAEFHRIRILFDHAVFVYGTVYSVVTSDRHLSVSYRFEYEGKQYLAESRLSFRKSLVVGMRVTVAVDPSNPKNSEIADKYV